MPLPAPSPHALGSRFPIQAGAWAAAEESVRT